LSPTGRRRTATRIGTHLGHATHVLDGFHVARWFAASMIEVRRRVQRIGPHGTRPALEPAVFRSRYKKIGVLNASPADSAILHDRDVGVREIARRIGRDDVPGVRTRGVSRTRSLLSNAVAWIGGQARHSQGRGLATPRERNGEAENAVSGDDWSARCVTCIAQRAPSGWSAPAERLWCSEESRTASAFGMVLPVERMGVLSAASWWRWCRTNAARPVWAARAGRTPRPRWDAARPG